MYVPGATLPTTKLASALPSSILQLEFVTKPSVGLESVHDMSAEASVVETLTVAPIGPIPTDSVKVLLVAFAFDPAS
jgi:hypothetical protein